MCFSIVAACTTCISIGVGASILHHCVPFLIGIRFPNQAWTDSLFIQYRIPSTGRSSGAVSTWDPRPQPARPLHLPTLPARTNKEGTCEIDERIYTIQVIHVVTSLNQSEPTYSTVECSDLQTQNAECNCNIHIFHAFGFAFVSWRRSHA
jgi:hypothetical protein